MQKKIFFYIGSEHENSLLNLMKHSKPLGSNLTLLYPSPMRIQTPSGTVSIKQDANLLNKLKKISSIKNVLNNATIRSTKLETSIFLNLTPYEVYFESISYSHGYKKAIQTLMNLINSFVKQYEGHSPTILLESNSILAKDILLYVKLTGNKENPTIFVNNVLTKKFEQLELTKDSSNTHNTIKTELDEFGYKKIEKDKGQKKGSGQEKEDEQRRLSIEAPLELDFEETKKTSIYDIRKIIGRDKLSGLKRTTMDYRANMSKNMEDMIDAIKSDDSVEIRINKVESKLVDNFKDRFMLYTITISHTVGYNKPYKISLKVPVPNESGYFKLGNNDYVLLSQLFSKSLLKISNSTVNLITNFGLLTTNIKSSKIDKNVDYHTAIVKMCETIGKTMIDFGKTDNVDKFIESTGVKSERDKKYIKHVIDGIIGKNINGLLEVNFKNATVTVDEDKVISCKENGVVIEFNEIQKTYPYEEFGSIVLTELDQYLIRNKHGHLTSSTTTRFSDWINLKIIGIGSFSFSSILGVRYSLKDILESVGVKYTLTPNKEKSAFKHMKIGDKYLNLYALTYNDRIIVNSIAKHNTTKFPIKSLTDKTGFESAIITKYNKSKLTNLMIALEKFIDKNTQRYLVEAQGTKSDLLDIVCQSMIPKLLNDPVEKVNDMNNYRIRQSEIIPQLMYKQLAMAIGRFKNNKHFDKRLDLDPDFIIKELQVSGLLAYTKGINPIEELSFATRVTKSGPGSVKSGMIMIGDRVSNKSYFGNISYTNTPEYGNIGVVHQTTLGLSIKNKFGDINVKPQDDNMNPIEFTSTSESNTPYIGNANPNRMILGQQQMAQSITTPRGGDRRLIQTGIEHVMNQMVSGRFIRRSPVTGVITEVNDKIVTIKDKFGQEVTISISDLISRTKRGVFIPLIIRPDVKVGQKVKANQIIASHVSFTKGEFRPHNNVWVAFMDSFGSNYEDGWAVTKDFTKQFELSNLNKMEIEIPQGAIITVNKLEEGSKVQSGEVIFEYKIPESLGLNTDTDQSEVVSAGLTINGNTYTYRSTGGLLKHVIVKLTRDTNLPTGLKELFDKSVDHLKKLVKSAEENAFVELDKSDALSNIDNLDSLNVGEFRHKGNDFEGVALITVYTEKPLKVGKGFKFVVGLGSGAKGTITEILDEDDIRRTEETKQKINMFPLTLGIFKRKNLNIKMSLYNGKIIWAVNEFCKKEVENGGAKAIPKIRDKVLEVFNVLDKDELMIPGIKQFFKQDSGTIIKAIRNSDSMKEVLFPMIAPPFKNKITIEDLNKASHVIGVPLDEKVVFEKYGTTTETKLTTGPLEIVQLEHVSDYQSGSRGALSTKRSILTGSGVSGSSSGKSAQKLGSYTLDSLLVNQESKDAIKEMQVFQSDNPNATKWFRNSIIRSIMRKDKLPSLKDYKHKESDITGINLVKTLWASMGIEFTTD